MLTAGVVLGVGLGGFINGIALHQIAQRHTSGRQCCRRHERQAILGEVALKLTLPPA